MFDPKMLTPFPNVSGEILEILPLKGVLGLPNSCIGRASFPKADGAGLPPKCMSGCFFDGVSGILVLLKRASGPPSMLRCFLEISPVDMNACGSGFAML